MKNAEALRGYQHRESLARTRSVTPRGKKAEPERDIMGEIISLRDRANSELSAGVTQNAARSQAMRQAALTGLTAMAASGARPAEIGRALQNVGGVGKGAVGNLARTLGKATSSKDLWRRIGQWRGGVFDIGGAHHDEPGYERDINVYRGRQRPAGEGMTSGAEQRYLSILMRAMLKAFGKQGGIELIGPRFGSYFGPGSRSQTQDPRHRAHGHISTPWF